MTHPDPIASLNAALDPRYRIERELGAGGMATVYLAHDIRHARDVAVKVLRPELAAAMGSERFLREITTTAGLRHPNILPLFDSGEADGHLFYVMPVIEGESLRDRLDREGPLPVEDALAIAGEVADALEYAHGRGVIHRDIKPENIMLENGHAVVADFGIAHAVSAPDTGRLTVTGMSLGTPHYMSPEQAAGEPVDARSDLYALGCMTFEMLAGDPPFTGSNAVAIMARHAMDPVPELTTVRPTVSRQVTAAIVRALAKVPADRFRTVAEWRQAIFAANTGPLPATAPVILKAPPVPTTPLLGREDQVVSVMAELAGTTRLITITGVGGTGKTRFAVELFRRLLPTYPEGAAFISLASVTSAADVMATVAVSLDINEAHGRSPVEAVATLVGHRRVLLVLDNLEQVLGAASDIAQLIAACPALTIVATSRAPLKIGAEVESSLPPLALPPQGAQGADELMACPSVALFVQRAAKVKPGFTVTADNADAVTGICRRLDGLPLALELAAARARVLEPAALLQRLDFALDLLTSGDRDLPLRQRTLRATISWSYSLLEGGEQRLLRHLSVFHEGWTLKAMEHVCFSEEERWRALDGLESLVEKGLVRVVGEAGRYTLLETIRAFSGEQLHASGEVAAARDAHAVYFQTLAEEIEAGIFGTTQLSAMQIARADTANLNAAVQWRVAAARAGDAAALEHGLRICGACTWLWHISGQHIAAGTYLDELLPLAEDGPPSIGRGLARLSCAMVCSVIGEPERGAELALQGLEDGIAVNDDLTICQGHLHHGYSCLVAGRMEEAVRSLELGVREGDARDFEFGAGICRTILGLARFIGGDVDAGIALVEEARRSQVRRGDHEGGGVGLSFLAQMTFAKGDLLLSAQQYREAEDLLATVGDTPEVARVQCEVGWVYLAIPDLDQARRTFKKALRTYDEVGSQRGLGLALLGLASAESTAGNAERALIIAAAAQELSERTGIVVEHPQGGGVLERIEELRSSIPQEQLDALMKSGSGMTPAAVLAMIAQPLQPAP